MRNFLLKYTVAAVILIIPLYSKFPFLRIPGTFVSVRLEDFLIVIAAIVVIAAYFGKLKTFATQNIFKSVYLYLAVGLVSLTSAIFITQSVEPHIGLLHWVRRIEYFIPLFLGYLAIKSDKKNLEFFIKLVILVLLISFVYGFGQKYYSWPIIITQNEEYAKGVALRWVEGSHINAFFAGHYDLATFLVSTLPMVSVFFFLLKGKILKGILAITYFSGLWLLVNAASRISILSYLVSVAIALILVKKYREIILIVVVSILFVSMSSNLLTRYTRILKVLEERFGSLVVSVSAQEKVLFESEKSPPTPTPIPQNEDRSTSIRLNVEWPRALRAFKKNPLLGTGYSSITLATDNDYLRALGEVGILGFLSFSLVILNLILLIFKNFPFNRFSGATLGYLASFSGALVGVLINAVFIDVFEASKFAIIFWLFSGFAVGLTET